MRSKLHTTDKIIYLRDLHNLILSQAFNMKILYINIDIGKFYIRDLQKMGKVTLARYITQRGIVQKIKQGKNFQGNINNTSLFPFAKRHPLNDSGGRLAEDGLVLLI